MSIPTILYPGDPRVCVLLGAQKAPSAGVRHLRADDRAAGKGTALSFCNFQKLRYPLYFSRRAVLSRMQMVLFRRRTAFSMVRCRFVR